MTEVTVGPEWPGDPTIRFRGANVTIKQGTTAPGWRKFWGEEWDWDWVKLQIDLAKAAGANAIRIIGAVNGIVGEHYTRATYHARQAQVIEYCAAEGLWYYAVGAGDYETDYTTATRDEMVALAMMLDGYANVISFEPYQEWDIWVDNNGQEAAFLAALEDWYHKIRAAGFSKLIGYSAVGTSDALEVGVFGDYIDRHSYSDPAETLYATLSSSSGGKQVLVGEFGANLGMSTGDRESRYQTVLDAVAYTNMVKGAFQWAIKDQSTSTSQRWGLYDDSNVIRDDIGDIYVTFPTTRTWP